MKDGKKSQSGNSPEKVICQLYVNLRGFFFRFFFLTTALLKIQVFWHVTLCRLVNNYRRFELRSLATSLSICQSTWHNNGEDLLWNCLQHLFLWMLVVFLFQNVWNSLWCKMSWNDELRACTIMFWRLNDGTCKGKHALRIATAEYMFIQSSRYAVSANALLYVCLW